MKLILKTIDTDGCTYSSDVYIGIEADGKDELGIMILEAIQAQLDRNQALTPPKRKERVGPFPAVIEINDTLIRVESDFSPEHDIMTLDEFFERVAIQNTKRRDRALSFDRGVSIRN